MEKARQKPQSVSLNTRNLQEATKAFISDHFGFTKEEADRNISQLHLSISGINAEGDQRVVKLIGTVKIAASEPSKPKTERFTLRAVITHNGDIADYHGQFPNLPRPSGVNV